MKTSFLRNTPLLLFIFFLLTCTGFGCEISSRLDFRSVDGSIQYCLAVSTGIYQWLIFGFVWGRFCLRLMKRSIYFHEIIQLSASSLVLIATVVVWIAPLTWGYAQSVDLAHYIKISILFWILFWISALLVFGTSKYR